MRIADYSVTKAVLERHGFTLKSPRAKFLDGYQYPSKNRGTAEIDDQVMSSKSGQGLVP